MEGGCGEGFDWWMGGGRGGTIEFQRILKREIVETRGNWIGGRSRLFRSSRNMVESGDASSRRLCAPGRARWHLWACTRALGAVVGKRCAREAGDCRDGRRRRHSSSRSQALTLGLFRCGTLDSRESASGAGRIDTSEAARFALRGDAFSVRSDRLARALARRRASGQPDEARGFIGARRRLAPHPRPCRLRDASHRGFCSGC